MTFASSGGRRKTDFQHNLGYLSYLSCSNPDYRSIANPPMQYFTTSSPAPKGGTTLMSPFI